jgi:hypothetical protein
MCGCRKVPRRVSQCPDLCTGNIVASWNSGCWRVGNRGMGAGVEPAGEERSPEKEGLRAGERKNESFFSLTDVICE